jgi:hypothetical protein
MFVAFIQKYRIITENSGHENIQRLFSEVMSRVLRDNYLMYLVLVTVLLTYFVALHIDILNKDPFSDLDSKGYPRLYKDVPGAEWL